MDGRGKFVAAPRPPQGAGSLERVFSDFCARRAGLIKALTTDAKEFRMACDPGKDNLCLYGLPNKQWVVKLPPQLVPPELPEPVLGINFSRDGTSEKDWMSLVAIHSDSWLLSVAFYSGTKLQLDRESRDQLFSMINDLPTVYEVFKENAQKESKEQTPESSSKGNTSGSKPSGPSRQLEPNSVSMMQPPKDEEESADQETEVCGACFKYHGQDHGENLFWIFCDVCEKWFHGACVNITPAYAALIKMYMCPSCRTSGKRAKSSA